MELSKDTIAIFKHMSLINPAILIMPGNVLRSYSESMMMEYNFKDKFPQRCCIGNLNKFINIATFFTNPDFSFQKDRLVITDSATGQTVTMPYSHEAAAKSHGREDFDPERTRKVCEFRMEADLIRTTEKMTSFLGTSYMSFVTRGKDIILRLYDQSGAIADNFERKIGEISSDMEFDIIVRVDNLRLLPLDYVVSIEENGLYFTGDSVWYMVSPEASSTFKG